MMWVTGQARGDAPCGMPDEGGNVSMVFTVTKCMLMGRQ